MTIDPFASIETFAALYRRQELSPVALTELFLSRIEQINPRINAFITVTGATALEAAQRAEAELRRGHDRGLLHGIPVALKDLIDTQSVRTTCGSKLLANNVPGESAALVARLEAAGAICLGKTNMLEFAYGVAHPDFGATLNPWDTSRTAGGSSGGSAAAIAAGLCCAAVGTDTGGSIRIPAAYCGVTGFKPSYGLIDLKGVFPLAWSLDHLGPIARSSRDAALLLEVLSGRSFPLAPGLGGKRLGVDPAYSERVAVEPAVLDTFEAMCERARELGAEIVEVRVAALEQANSALLEILLPEATLIHSDTLDREDAYAPGTLAQLRAGLTLPAVTYLRAKQFQEDLKARTQELFLTLDGLLTPTAPWVAPAEDPSVTGEDGAAEMHFTGPFNLLGLPALSLPCAVSAGLPIGLQIVTPYNQDALALSLGDTIDQANAVNMKSVHQNGNS